MEEGQSLPEGLRFMVPLDAEPLASMDLSQTVFQHMIDFVGAQETC